MTHPTTSPAPPPATYVALVHHPVYDRAHRVVTTAITNLDLHDIARSCRTFGVAGYFVVTPVAAQRELAQRIVGHWVDGEGREQNSLRSEAVALVEVAADLAEVVRVLTARAGAPPLCVATAARPATPHRPPLDWDAVPAYCAEAAARAEAAASRPLLLIFGTGWGLTDEVLAAADALLPPVARTIPPSTTPLETEPEYNHLSVRSAVAIVLDRLFGHQSPWYRAQRTEVAR